MRKTTTILSVFIVTILGVWFLQNSIYQIAQAASFDSERTKTIVANSPPGALTAIEWERIRSQIVTDISVNSPWLQQAKLTSSNGAAFDDFGAAVAVSGDTAVIGAYGDDHNGIGESGAAYIFTRNGTTWSQQAKLTAADSAAGSGFGRQSVAVDGNTVVISAYNAAYVFTRNGTTWSQQAKLIANVSGSDGFGNSVAVDGDTVIVGAYWDDSIASDSGAAYVFTRNGTTWSQQTKLTANDGTTSDWFGSSVAVSGNTAIIGMYLDDDKGNNSGSAYTFTRNGIVWSQQAKLTADDGAAEDGFGIVVAMSGDTIIIGADGDDDNGEDSGSAYIFIRNGSIWEQQAKLVADDGAAIDNFGRSVSVSEDTAVVGTPFQDNGDSSAFVNYGAAYVFTRNGTTWSQQAKLSASDGEVGDEFGISVAVNDDTIVIGAHFDDIIGSAYIFSKTTSETVIGAGGGMFAPTDALTFTFPSGAFSEPVTVTYTTIPSITTDLQDVGVFYELTAVSTLTNQPAQLEPGKTFTTVVQYNEANLPSGVSEDSLKLFYQTEDGAAQQPNSISATWEPASSSVVDTVKNEITAVDSRLGTWAVFADGAEYEVFLPAVIKP